MDDDGYTTVEMKLGAAEAEMMAKYGKKANSATAKYLKDVGAKTNDDRLGALNALENIARALSDGLYVIEKEKHEKQDATHH